MLTQSHRNAYRLVALDIDGTVLSSAQEVSAELREVLARLETKQQVLILGHAGPMPVVVHTRDYRDLYGEIAGYALDTDEAAALLYG